MTADNYLYVTPHFERGAELVNTQLATFTERHQVELGADPLASRSAEPPSPIGNQAGIVIEMLNGWPWPAHLRLAQAWNRAGKRAFFYWPAESAIEVADTERIRSYWHLCLGKR